MESYKALENVERVFRGLNTDLLIRPIRHRLAERVRAHVLIRMLAYYVTWHMQHKLAPMLFKDDDPAPARAARPSPVAPARRSPSALAKDATKATGGGQPVHSLATLLDDLATITANRIQPTSGLPTFTLITTPPPSSAKPSNCSASHTASGTRSQAAPDHRSFPQAATPPVPSGGSSG